MKNIFFKTFILATVFAALSTISFAQSSLTGTWKLKEKTSLTGPNYLNGVASKLVVQQTSEKISIERTSPTGNQDNPEVSYAETLPLDGKPGTTTTTDQKKKTATIKFTADKTGFTENATISDPDVGNIIYKTTETWTVSNDGKTLTLIKSFESASDEKDKWSMKGVYEKQ